MIFASLKLDLFFSFSARVFEGLGGLGVDTLDYISLNSLSRLDGS